MFGPSCRMRSLPTRVLSEAWNRVAGRSTTLQSTGGLRLTVRPEARRARLGDKNPGNDERKKDVEYFKDAIESLTKHSPNATTFVLIHKLDTWIGQVSFLCLFFCVCVSLF